MRETFGQGPFLGVAYETWATHGRKVVHAGTLQKFKCIGFHQSSLSWRCVMCFFDKKLFACSAVNCVQSKTQQPVMSNVVIPKCGELFEITAAKTQIDFTYGAFSRLRHVPTYSSLCHSVPPPRFSLSGQAVLYTSSD